MQVPADFSSIQLVPLASHFCSFKQTTEKKHGITFQLICDAMTSMNHPAHCQQQGVIIHEHSLSLYQGRGIEGAVTCTGKSLWLQDIL